MKKILMGLTTCALVLSSCNQNEVFENIDQNNSQLSFSLVKGTQTRAAELTATAMQGGNIDIWAMYTASNDEYFQDKLGYGTGKWNTVDHIRFMPVGKALDFIAVYPQGAATTLSHDGTNYKFDYTIEDDGTTTDLVGATSFNSTSTAVTLNMRHLLSQVNFGVYAYEGANIVISDIQIVDVAEAGTFKFATASDGKGAWADQSGVKTYSYEAYEGENIVSWEATTGDKYIFGDGGNWAVDNAGNEGEVWYWGATAGDWVNKPVAATGRTEDLITNSLMLMPQSFTDNTIAKITFHYNITDGEGNLVTEGDGSFLLADRDDWVEGYRYVYMIDFRTALEGQELDNWTIDLDMYPWVNYNEGGVNDGIVDAPMVSEPTAAGLNALTNGNNVILSGALTSNTVWDWSAVAFTGLVNGGDAFTLDFATAKNAAGATTGVIFNGKSIEITVPAGFTASTVTAGASVALQVVTITANTAIVTITKD